MKRALIVVFILCLPPDLSYSHPGKTDRYGGHKCLKGCEDWGLYYEEYHFHDKEGKPIRVSKKEKVKAPETAGLKSNATETVVRVDKVKTEITTSYQHITKVTEENVFLPNPLLFILLILLLLLLLLIMNRNSEKR